MIGCIAHGAKVRFGGDCKELLEEAMNFTRVPYGIRSWYSSSC